MKVASIFLFLLFVGSAQYLAAQQPTPSPQKEPEVTINEVLDRLRYASEQDTLADTNSELIDAVRRRGIWYVLNDKDRKLLKAAGASDELLAKIDKALPDSEKKRFEDIYGLYMVIVENYSVVYVPNTKLAIQACKELLTKYGDEPRIKEQLDWVRDALPKLERRLH